MLCVENVPLPIFVVRALSVIFDAFADVVFPLVGKLLPGASVTGFDGLTNVVFPESAAFGFCVTNGVEFPPVEFVSPEGDGVGFVVEEDVFPPVEFVLSEGDGVGLDVTEGVGVSVGFVVPEDVSVLSVGLPTVTVALTVLIRFSGTSASQLASATRSDAGRIRPVSV